MRKIIQLIALSLLAYILFPQINAAATSEWYYSYDNVREIKSNCEKLSFDKNHKTKWQFLIYLDSLDNITQFRLYVFREATGSYVVEKGASMKFRSGIGNVYDAVTDQQFTNSAYTHGNYALAGYGNGSVTSVSTDYTDIEYFYELPVEAFEDFRTSGIVKLREYFGPNNYLDFELESKDGEKFKAKFKKMLEGIKHAIENPTARTIRERNKRKLNPPVAQPSGETPF